MTAQLYEFDWAMSVMDGRRCIAKARKYQGRGWLLRLESGCWVDAKTDPERNELTSKYGHGDKPFYPHLKIVRTKRAARQWLQSLTLK